MLVEMQYHLWHSNMADYRIRMLKADKRQLQDDIIKLKTEIKYLKEEK